MSTHICSSFNNVNATKNQKILVFVLALVTSIVASVGVIDAQEPFPEFNPTSKKIKKFGKAFDIIKLSSDGQKLKPDFEENRQAAQELFSKVRNSLNSSSSSSSSGGSSWASSMTSAGFTAACGLGHSSQFQIGKTNRFWVFVEESDSDKTTVQIEVDKKGLISVNFSSDGGAIFRFRQKSNGQVYCQDLASR